VRYLILLHSRFAFVCMYVALTCFSVYFQTFVFLWSHALDCLFLFKLVTCVILYPDDLQHYAMKSFDPFSQLAHRVSYESPFPPSLIEFN
jgi:hypothetical protein